MRSVWVRSAIAATGLAVGLGLAVAAPASAATQVIPINCNGDIFARPGVITAAQGDTLVFTPTSGVCTSARWLRFPQLVTDPSDQSGPGPYTFTIAFDAPVGSYGAANPSFSIVTIQDGRWPPDGQSFDIVIVAAPSAAAPSPIPTWVQAYGRQEVEKCLDGWDASWQPWAEPVTGGWVCTRSIPSLG